MGTGKHKSVEARRAATNSAEVEQRVADYAASGLSQRELCRRRGISETTLKRWRRRMRTAGTKAADATPWVNVGVQLATAGGDR